MGKTKTQKLEEKIVAEDQKVDQSEAKAKLPKVGKAKTRGKKYIQNKAKIDKARVYPIDEAVALVKQVSYSKFDGAVELHLVVKKTGLSVQVNLPFAAGKEKRIEVADEKTIDKLKTGKIDFDVLLATAEMMPKLVSFARLLGPRGLMPNPKNGTLIKNAAAASKFSKLTTTLKTEKKAPIIHCVAGKISQETSQIEQNVQTAISAVGTRQILRAFIKPTMGPSIKLQLPNS